MIFLHSGGFRQHCQARRSHELYRRERGLGDIHVPMAGVQTAASKQNRWRVDIRNATWSCPAQCVGRICSPADCPSPCGFSYSRAQKSLPDVSCPGAHREFCSCITVHWVSAFEFIAADGPPQRESGSCTPVARTSVRLDWLQFTPNWTAVLREIFNLRYLRNDASQSLADGTSRFPSTRRIQRCGRRPAALQGNETAQ